MNLKLKIGIMGVVIGVTLAGTLLRTDATTSYMGSDLSISDGLLVYIPQPAPRDGQGYVGIGLSNVNAYLLAATPNLGIAGTVRIKGAVSNIENVNVTSNSAVEVDWRTGNNQRVNLTGGLSDLSFTFRTPNGTASLTLQINYSSEAYYPWSFTWPDNVKWPGGNAPSYSTGATPWSRSTPRTGIHFDIFYFFYEAGRGVYYGVKGVATK